MDNLLKPEGEKKNHIQDLISKMGGCLRVVYRGTVILYLYLRNGAVGQTIIGHFFSNRDSERSNDL